MQSFRNNIIGQIENISEGKIFTLHDLSYTTDKLANVCVILSELTTKKKLSRIAKGAYYKPQKSTLGLGILPVYQEEQFNYLTKKLNGYLSGPYIYNKMGLTEQLTSTITIATPKPVRKFTFRKLRVECIKAYADTAFYEGESLLYIRLLDAIKDIKHISGKNQQDIYNAIKLQYLSLYEDDTLTKIVSLAKVYPPRVRKVLCDMMNDLEKTDQYLRLSSSILPTTRFNFNYQSNNAYESTYRK